MCHVVFHRTFLIEIPCYGVFCITVLIEILCYGVFCLTVIIEFKKMKLKFAIEWGKLLFIYGYLVLDIRRECLRQLDFCKWGNTISELFENSDVKHVN